MSSLWIAEDALDLARQLRLDQVEDGWREDLPGKVINDRGDRQVVRIEIVEPARIVYLKRWRLPSSSPWRCLPGRKTLRQRARVEFRNLELLRSLGLVVPAPLVFGETPSLFGPSASILLLEGLVNHINSGDWIRKHPEDRLRIAAGIARVLGRMHSHGLFYRSPGLKHFYVHQDPAVEELAVIDVPRLDPSPGRWQRWVADLLGEDIPSPERDLSKVDLTLRGELGADRDILDGFWEVYLGELKGMQVSPTLRARVEEESERRLRSRGRRSDRRNPSA